VRARRERSRTGSNKTGRREENAVTETKKRKGESVEDLDARIREMEAELAEGHGRPLIDRALSEHGQAPRSIIRRYRGLSRLAVRRHRDGCLAGNVGGGVIPNG
jgi:broad specificity phosphatase PhoE